MSLYKKHRPTDYSDIIGNKETVESIESMLNKKEHPHSFLLSGESGCGKTTIARIMAKQLDCHSSEIREIDAAVNRGIDEVRNIIDKSHYKPMQGSSKVFIIDECHEVTKIAQDALLKVLEDTPDHVYFILCTTNPEGLKKTIKGRCSQFKVKKLTDKEMMKAIRRVVKLENESITKPVYEQIISSANGHVRNALVILEQVLNVDSDNRLEAAKTANIIEKNSIELARALLKGGNWKNVCEILKGLRGEEPEGIRRVVLGYMTSVILGGKRNDVAGLILEIFNEPVYNSGFPGIVFYCYSVIYGQE